MSGSEDLSSLVGEQRGGTLLDIQRPTVEQEAGSIGELVQRMGARLELRHRAHKHRFLVVGYGKPRRDQLDQARIVRLPDVMAVEVLELLEIEARGRLADLRQVEPLDRLATADDLVVAMAP